MKTNLEDYSQYCQIVGATDIGCKRAANEDFLGFDDTPNGRVAVVCDGMGGHVGGATASHIAVDSILAYLRDNYHTDPNEAITEAIFTANRNILLHAQMHPELTGMGSTCVLLLVRNGKVYIGHVGDSRIYLIRESTIKQLTKDHSFVQTLVDAGQISEAEAEHHPRKNEITNALGIPNMQPATIREEAILPQAGDVFLLCSDGLSNMVPNTTIAKIAGKIGTNMQHRADTLIEQARENGGLDNITCELVEFSITTTEKRGHSKNDDKRKKNILQFSFLALALLLLGGGGYFFWESLSPQSIIKDFGIIDVPQNKKICTIIFREDETIIQNSSGDCIWHEPGFKANQDSVLYDVDMLSITEKEEDRISLQIKDGANLEKEEECSFILQDGRHRRTFHFKVSPFNLKDETDKEIIKRPVTLINLGSIKAGKNGILVSITPGYSSQIEIKNPAGTSLWKRSISEMAQDSIIEVSPKIEIKSKNSTTTTIVLKKKNDYPENDSAVFSINGSDTIFTFFFQFPDKQTHETSDSGQSKHKITEVIDSAKDSISQNNPETPRPSDKSTEGDSNHEIKDGGESAPADSSATSPKEEPAPPTVQV